MTVSEVRNQVITSRPVLGSWTDFIEITTELAVKIVTGCGVLCAVTLGTDCLLCLAAMASALVWGAYLMSFIVIFSLGVPFFIFRKFSHLDKDRKKDFIICTTIFVSTQTIYFNKSWSFLFHSEYLDVYRINLFIEKNKLKTGSTI